MAEKEFAPFSQSSNSKNLEFLENKSERFYAPSGSSSAIVGEIIGHSTSLPNTTTTNNNNEQLVMPTSPPRAPSSKRSRGRPKGSKNKPKTPAVVMVEPQTLMKQIFIEIPAGYDVLESIIKMAWRHEADITVLRGFGIVSDITIHSSLSHTPPLTIEGPVQMTSLSGTYVNPNVDNVPSEVIANPACSSFSIFLSGSHGQVYGGIVVGKVMTSSVVMISATLMKKTKFYMVA
ncbi:putative PPC domain-containing protein [Medicago truncatula]|uniref:DUF296 domain protein n=1 Tax=Medicago truncatula TaxID=3880 RepID=G7K354_MEDTR|nr:AT-hook motif nuclear-localized protein 21 [Medicago truncatula]AET00226.1 DUF296 domain protein [Medicago truncatula]RHN57572.1 putative PPC domain-containing protein [Medicago truncatula]